MNLIITSILLFICGSSAIPVEQKLNPLAAYTTSDDVELADFDTMVGKVTSDYLQDASVQDGAGYIKRKFPGGRALGPILELMGELCKKSIETIKPSLISIVADGTDQILTDLFFRDWEGLKDTVRGMIKKVIIAFDDEMIRRILEGRAELEEEWSKIKNWTISQLKEGINKAKDDIVEGIQNALLDLVDTITKKILGIVGLGSGYNANLKLPNFTKMLEKIKGMGPKLLGDVLNDQAFVDRELQRYKDALHDALPFMGKTVIVMLVDMVKLFFDIMEIPGRR